MYWQKQTDKPLFPELEWDKPERRDQAGKLLIIGGYLHNLNAPAASYQHTKEQGIGDVKVALPDKTRALLGKTLPSALFLPSTTSGELAHNGLNQLLEWSNWADTILIAGDIGRNSQTTLLIADLVQNVTNQLVITKDAIEALQNTPEIMVKPQNTTLVVSFAQLQRIVQNLRLPTALTFDMDTIKLVDFLHMFTSENPCAIATVHQNNLLVAVNGQVITTKLVQKQSEEPKSWRTEFASYAACYQTWNPSKHLEALSSSAFQLANTQKSE